MAFVYGDDLLLSNAVLLNFFCICFDYFSAVLTEQHYREALENVASYNSRLCTERRQRLPFLDSQTGVAQNHTNLFIPYRYRGPGTTILLLLLFISDYCVYSISM